MKKKQGKNLSFSVFSI